MMSLMLILPIGFELGAGGGGPPGVAVVDRGIGIGIPYGERSGGGMPEFPICGGPGY